MKKIIPCIFLILPFTGICQSAVQKGNAGAALANKADTAKAKISKQKPTDLRPYMAKRLVTGKPDARDSVSFKAKKLQP